MISVEDVYRSFVGSLSLNVKMLRQYCQATSIDFVPRVGSALRVASSPNATLRLPLDSVIAPPVLVEHAWDTATVRLVRQLIEGRIKTMTLVDVGANVGLFSRQLLNISPEIRQAFVYEPHPGNFLCLLHNLTMFSNVRAFNDALGVTEGMMTFYLDPNNFGNYSINQAAMPVGQQCLTIPVSVRAVSQEAKQWVSADLPIFYKSDTQGHDELLATSIDPSFWGRVFAGVLETWSIDKPTYSRESLARMMDEFPNKRFVQDIDTPVGTSEILEYAECRDGTFKDVLFWK